MTSPSVTVSLAPSGGLQLELPGHADGLRAIPLRWTTAVDPARTIERVLASLAQGQSAIGEDGAPTRQQLAHWERHGTFPDARCVFCQSESAIARIGRGGADGGADEAHKSSSKFDARYVRRELGNGVTVQRLRTGAKTPKAKRAKAPVARSAKTAKELGF
jgi:hypothetical protein